MSTKFFNTQQGKNINSYYKEAKTTNNIEDVQKKYLTEWCDDIKEDKSILTWENVIRYYNGSPMNE